MADEYIKRQGLLDAYDAAHKGPPGGARKLIAEAPAEDVVPVVHGRWEEIVENWVECSICGDEWNGAVVPYEDFKYCPNCGAHMKDGE